MKRAPTAPGTICVGPAADHIGNVTGQDGTYQQTTTPSPDITTVFTALDVPLTPTMRRLDTPAEGSTPAA